MADVAPNYEERQEFWKPAGFPRPESLPAEASESTCRQCKSDLIVGSQFCHTCGAEQRSIAASPWRRFPSRQSFTLIRDALGQSTASLGALILGCVCLMAALLTGFIFTASTLLDWQAIQLWRIEWLLAAIALFAAGILLQKTR
ncbi:MAG TPA: hypothetical protein VI488_11825 [Candidatus Angelobacter sp.]